MSITQASVARIIEKKGENAVWRKVTGGTYNPATGKYSGETITTYNVTAHYRNYKPKEITGILEQGDKELRMSTDVQFTPMEGDTVLIDGSDYRVMGVDDRLRKLYVVHLRGIR